MLDDPGGSRGGGGRAFRLVVGADSAIVRLLLAVAGSAGPWRVARPTALGLVLAVAVAALPWRPLAAMPLLPRVAWSLAWGLLASAVVAAVWLGRWRPPRSLGVVALVAAVVAGASGLGPRVVSSALGAPAGSAPRRDAAVLGLAAGVLLLVNLALGAWHAVAARPARPEEHAAGGDPADPVAGLPAQFDEVERFCREAFPDHFAGLGLVVDVVDDADLRRLGLRGVGIPVLGTPGTGMPAPVAGEVAGAFAAIVFRVPGGDLDATVRERFPHLSISFEDAAHSHRDLAALTERIVRDLDSIADRGVTVTTLRQRADGSGLEVVTADVERARHLLADAYGPAVVVVAPDEPPVA
jgi:hypothetical protein